VQHQIFSRANEVLIVLTVKANNIDQIDTILASGPFGDGESIVYNTRTFYVGLQRLIEGASGLDLTDVMSSSAAEVMVIARATLDEAFLVLADAPHIAHEKLVKLKQDFISFSNEESRSPVPFVSKVESLAFGDWSSKIFRRAIAERFKDSMERDGLIEEFRILEPTALHQEVINKAKTLIESLIPKVVAKTLPLVHGIAIVEGKVDSAYIVSVPLMFMLNVRVLDDQLQTADSILHESLHQKMFDIRLTRQLLREDYNDRASEERGDVPIPWGASSPRKFSIARGLATEHVYIHTAFLYVAALEHLHSNAVLRDVGGNEIIRRLYCSFERASYLADCLASDAVARELGRDGVRFRLWMDQVLEQLREIRLSDGTYLGDYKVKFGS
jgi:hypothetical protein